MISQATLPGFRLRDEGIAKLERHAWLHRARLVASASCGHKGTFTSDDLHEWLDEPPHPNCWGALFHDRRFRPTGTYVKSTRKEAHAREIKVWQLA